MRKVYALVFMAFVICVVILTPKPHSTVAATAGCNDVLVPGQEYCVEQIGQNEVVNVVAAQPGINLFVEVAFSASSEVRVGCQLSNGVLWLETTTTESDEVAMWHQTTNPGSDYWVALQYTNWGVGTLAECELWGQTLYGVPEPLEGVIETSSGTYLRFALPIDAHLSDGDEDDNRIVEGGTTTTTTVATTTTTQPNIGGAQTFADVDLNHTFFGDIEWLAESGITFGCGTTFVSGVGDVPIFCPKLGVNRGQMAAFIHRGIPDLPEVRAAIDFTDDDGNVFEGDIEWLYSRGVTQGTSATTYGPNQPVTRGQMAAFLHRALPDLPEVWAAVDFTDDDGNVFESDIEWLAKTGVTLGCNPPTNDRFCPATAVTREQMAAFLHRALGD